MNGLKKAAILLINATVLILSADIVLAHPGHLVHDPSSTSLLLGLQHPLTGVDHMLAMLAVGIWSALTHSKLRQVILAPISFFAMLLVGVLLGIAGMRLPGIEPVIMTSLLVLGLLVASCTAMRGWISVLLIGFFALFHGLAHGVALPVESGIVAYVAGFMTATLLLHLVGLLVGFQLKRYSRWVAGVLGAAIAAYGAILLVGI